jgi:hypothetical protein
VSTRSPSQRAVQKLMNEELEIAERRGADRVRAQVRDLLADRRRVVRQGDHQIEVVEVSALAELLRDGPE